MTAQITKINMKTTTKEVINPENEINRSLKISSKYYNIEYDIGLSLKTYPKLNLLELYFYLHQ